MCYLDGGLRSDSRVRGAADAGIPEDASASSNYRLRNSVAERSDFPGITWISRRRNRMMTSTPKFMLEDALLLSITPGDLRGS